jgi:hypothetical protein
MGVFAGHPITGKFWASGKNPCWSGAAHNFSYHADVTTLVTGNGRYNLHGFASGQTNGSDPFKHGSAVPMLEGATLIVIFHKASMSRVVIQIGQGAFESQAGRLLSARMSGFTKRRNGSVRTSYIVADGQLKGNKARFNGHTLGIGFPGASPQARSRYSHGDLWDTVSVFVGTLVKAGARSVTMAVVAPRQRRLGGASDCIVWVGQVLSVGIR